MPGTIWIAQSKGSLSMRFWLTVVIMLILIGSAHRFGRGPERVAANLLGANLLLSIFNAVIVARPNFLAVDAWLAVIDGFTFLGLTWIALYANRIWPLFVAALQLIVIIAHASVLISVGWTRVYYGMMALSQYFELVALAWGIAAHHVRERRYGHHREWRHGFEPPAFLTTSWSSSSREADRQSTATKHVMS